jgi:hypothetical protein
MKKVIIAGVAIVAIAGIILWYRKYKQGMVSSPAPTTTPNTTGAAAPATATSPGASASATDVNKMTLLTRYAGQAKQMAVLNSADPETLRRWALVVSLWNSGANPYGFDLSGNPSTDYNGSIGKWWEGFSTNNNF